MTDGLLLRLIELGQLLTILSLGTALLIAHRHSLATRALALGIAHLWVTFSFAIGIALNATMTAPVTPGLKVLVVLLTPPVLIVLVVTYRSQRDARK